MSDEIYTPFSGLIDELRALCDSGKTGVLFIATKANRSAQLMLEDGRIVFVYFFNKRGRDGLKAMTQIKAGKFRFQEGPINAQPMDLPPTGEIIDFLKTAAAGKAADLTGSETDAPVSQPSAPLSAGGLTDGQKKALEDLLAFYIGPMAAIICEDHLESATDFAGAVDALASEIPSPDQAAKFISEANSKIG